MTDEQLRKALAKALCRAAYPSDRFPNLNVDEQATDPHWSEQADAAIALMRPVIRAAALEEAADAVGEIGDHADVGAYINAIRALKEKPNG